MCSQMQSLELKKVLNAIHSVLQSTSNNAPFKASSLCLRVILLAKLKTLTILMPNIHECDVFFACKQKNANKIA